MWTANPSSQGTCTLYSLPVSLRTHLFAGSALVSPQREIMIWQQCRR
jgi:hypothetical protein